MAREGREHVREKGWKEVQEVEGMRQVNDGN